MTPILAEPQPMAPETAVAQSSERQPETWAASRARSQRGEKAMMASYFANHDFLLQDGINPSSSRDTVASFLVNQGTSPNAVAQACLDWIAEHANQGPFHLTWYSPGALLPATLYEFRQGNPHLSAATHVHLFPGTIDLQLQAQIGTEAQDYARGMRRRRFSYMILSGHSIDLRTGVVRFHFDREIPIQQTCALLDATQKFLFFDSQKFSGEGEVGYSLRELLSTCNAVVLYTVSAPNTGVITDAFSALCSDLLTADAADSVGPEMKSLRLTIVGSDVTSTASVPMHGFLRKAPRETPGATARVP